MSKDITTPYQVSKLTYQHQSWQELELLSDNLHLAFSLTPMIHYQASSQVTMQSESMLHNERELESTLEELEELVQKLEVVKSNIRELYLSSRSSNPQLDVVHKMESEVDQLQSTFQSGIKKSKTFLSSKTTKEPKTTGLENSIIRYNYPKSFTKGFWKTEK